MWLMIFPEGTRHSHNAHRKLQKSWAYSDSFGLERLNNVLMPRSAGFEVTTSVMIIIQHDCEYHNHGNFRGGFILFISWLNKNHEI